MAGNSLAIFLPPLLVIPANKTNPSVCKIYLMRVEVKLSSNLTDLRVKAPPCQPSPWWYNAGSYALKSIFDSNR